MQCSAVQAVESLTCSCCCSAWMFLLAASAACATPPAVLLGGRSCASCMHARATFASATLIRCRLSDREDEGESEAEESDSDDEDTAAMAGCI